MSGIMILKNNEWSNNTRFIIRQCNYWPELQTEFFEAHTGVRRIAMGGVEDRVRAEHEQLESQGRK